MPNVKTVTLTGGETAVTFGDSYPYYMITNMGNSEIYASGNPGIEPYADGVYTIPAGVEIRISPEYARNTIYLFGSGKVQVRAEEIAAQTSFKLSAKGGDSGGQDTACGLKLIWSSDNLNIDSTDHINPNDPLANIVPAEYDKEYIIHISGIYINANDVRRSFLQIRHIYTGLDKDDIETGVTSDFVTPIIGNYPGVISEVYLEMFDNGDPYLRIKAVNTAGNTIIKMVVSLYDPEELVYT